MNIYYLCISFPLILCEYHSIQLFDAKEFINSLYNSNFLLESQVESVLDCAMQCVDVSECNGLFYNKDSLKCKLMPVILEDVSHTTASPGWRYFKKQPVVKCLLSITIVGAALKIPSDVEAGDIIYYQCVPGFETTSGSGGSIQCLPDGNWSEPSNECNKCATYSNTFTMRPGMLFFPPDTIMDHYPITTGDEFVVTAIYCQQQCSFRPDFTCVAAYYKRGHCFQTWIRVEENITLYSQYYQKNEDYNEYVRECQ